MWICNECGEKFEEPDNEYVNAEVLYGVSSMFDNSNNIPIAVCPECGSWEIEEYYDDEED